MAIYQLQEDSYVFPNPSLAEADGLLAVGGDLSVGRLIEAYHRGIFPWYEKGSPILWWSPDPRFILMPGDFHVAKSLKKTLRKKEFLVTFDKNFRGVIEGCSQSRAKTEGTWILPEMIEAYCQLHTLGIAHSIEVWKNTTLVGGLYGISLGDAFFGESMFFTEPNASKVALYYLVEHVGKLQPFSFIDCQQETENLKRFGAKAISRSDFLYMLTCALKKMTVQCSWLNTENFL